MVIVEFLGPINKDDMKLDIKNLAELSEILKNDKEISSWLETCAVAINDTLICSKDFDLTDGDKISLLPPVCGG
ncbi:MoaD/ThiS family protein [Arcobacter caeni]|uniref:Molybdopterin synthase sulfur carrier subunit n=1 Tax=Arcobacter caeni TaxID=1912877 RepID=A0A363CWN2_9BACT|nr:MoaD/ThiS family protein [Arcobacter caeni]PUE63505.1 molybdopterin synthase sulfur carrier subunit [Arcobacter caeni]